MKSLESPAKKIHPAGRALVFDHFLPCRLKMLNQRTLALLASTHDGVGISEAEFGIMMVLSQQDGTSSRDIHKVTGMDKAMITRALDRLDSKGLISRSGNKTDRRLNHVKLTARGKSIYKLIEGRALHWEKEFIRGVNISEFNQLNRILSKLEANLDRLGTAP